MSHTLPPDRELKNALAELEALGYAISHDLRAPLRAVEGLAQILLEDFGPALPPDARQLLDRLTVNTARMGRLVDDLAKFLRLARQPLLPRRVNMVQLIERALYSARKTEPQRQVRVEVGALPEAIGDTALLGQAIECLISNAYKFTRHAIDASIEITGGVEGSECIYAVRDNGVGFDTRYAQRLFGVFQRLHRLEDYEGTGVGLAMARRIIERHGGSISAESAPGQGASFTFSLPAQ